MTPDKAFILAAGFGTRLRPITETRPKPMAEVAGETLINRTINHLKSAGINEMVVNSHYLADILTEHLNKRNDVKIHISHEPEILDTGGGIKNALDYFNGEDFFVLSGDGLWSDSKKHQPCLTQLAEFWDPEKMDILMLLQPIETMAVTKGVGDYNINPDGRALRSLDQSGTHMFTSIRINSAHIFDSAPDGAFSYLTLMDQAQEAGRLYAISHEGDWHHISTPDDLNSVNALFGSEKS